MPDVNRDQEALLGSDVGAEDRSDDLNAPVEWAGLPAFHPAPKRDVQLVLSFESEEDRQRLIDLIEIVIAKKTRGTWSAWWPPRDREDLSALRFDFDAPEQGEPGQADLREGRDAAIGAQPEDEG